MQLSPSSGPQKSFKELLIQGCGFWDSDRIIVTFTNANGNRGDPDPYIVNPNPKPRSAPGKNLLLMCLEVNENLAW